MEFSFFFIIDNMKKILYFIPSCIILFFIFGFSAQNGEQSGSLSYQIYEWLNHLVTLPFSKETVILLIRKAAHMSEFGVLSLTLYYGFSHTLEKHHILVSLIMTFLFACLDEWHQTFVPGRAGCFTDCLIDLSGAIIFMAVLYLIKKSQSH